MYPQYNNNIYKKFKKEVSKKKKKEEKTVRLRAVKWVLPCCSIWG
jgi:hypothetical protein